MVKSRKNLLRSIYKKLESSFGPQHWWPARSRFEVIVGAILTQNTNWTNVEKALLNLKRKKKLNLKSLKSLPTKDLAELIRPSGYFNIKAKRLKNLVNFIDFEYHGNFAKMSKQPLPKLRKELLSVNGVGAETADSILLYAFDKPIFVVDAYTKRILMRHGIVHEGSTYHEIQDIFMNNLNKRVRAFNEYHALIVQIGKQHCKPKMNCEKCPLNHADFFLSDER